MNPPIAGPRMRAVLNVPALSGSADARSSAGTMWLIIDWRVGISTTDVQPLINATAVISQNDANPCQTANARKNADSANNAWQTMSTTRLLARSANQPPNGDRKNIGTDPMKVIRPSACALPVRSKTSHCWPVFWIQLPIKEKNAPNQ